MGLLAFPWQTGVLLMAMLVKAASTASLMKMPARCCAPTYQCPPSDADPHTVDRTGGELGPVGQLTVVLAGQLARLRDARHGLGELQAVTHVSLRPI